MTVERAGHVRLPLTLAGVLAFFLLVADMPLWKRLLALLLPGTGELLYPRSSLLELVAEHLALVGVSSALAVGLGVTLGIIVTRPRGRAFLPLASDLASLGQTIPPVAILALSVPLLGFGARPTVLALFLYSILPVVRNTIAGLDQVPADIIEAARGMGMTPAQRLLRVELPLALPVIMTGTRTAVIVNIGTAVVGAVVGAGGLGTAIIAGLVRENTAFVLEGAIPAALLALLVDQVLGRIEELLGRGELREPKSVE
jgi:osmoprotectant transport system permease protein